MANAMVKLGSSRSLKFSAGTPEEKGTIWTLKKRVLRHGESKIGINFNQNLTLSIISGEMQMTPNSDFVLPILVI